MHEHLPVVEAASEHDTITSKSGLYNKVYDRSLPTYHSYSMPQIYATATGGSHKSECVLSSSHPLGKPKPERRTRLERASLRAVGTGEPNKEVRFRRSWRNCARDQRQPGGASIHRPSSFENAYHTAGISTGR